MPTRENKGRRISLNFSDAWQLITVCSKQPEAAQAN